MPTTAGSMALITNDTGRDAPIVEKLKAAGAIILGKTNLSEWANFALNPLSAAGVQLAGFETRICYQEVLVARHRARALPCHFASRHLPWAPKPMALFFVRHP